MGSLRRVATEELALLLAFGELRCHAKFVAKFLAMCHRVGTLGVAQRVADT
jgi:hypothetical protein